MGFFLVPELDLSMLVTVLLIKNVGHHQYLFLSYKAKMRIAAFNKFSCYRNLLCRANDHDLYANNQMFV